VCFNINIGLCKYKHCTTENPALNLVAGGNNVFYGIANNDGTGASVSGAVYSWNPSSNSYVAVVDNIPNPAGTPVVASDDWQEQNGFCRNGQAYLTQNSDRSGKSWSDSTCYWEIGNWGDSIKCAS
jgi:hypothetical protein